MQKALSELKEQIRSDILELAGIVPQDTRMQETRKDDGKNLGRYDRYSTRRRVLPPSARARLGRLAAISAATVYLWSFVAHPAALIGFCIALVDLLVGLDAAFAKARYALAKDMRTHATAMPSWVERTRGYRWARKEFQERLRIAASGVALAGSQAARARKSLNIFFATAPAMVLAGGLASAVVHPYLVFIAIVPGAVIAFPFLLMKFRKEERKEVDDELPFFLITAEMFALIERPLVHAFEVLARKDLLPKMRREAEIVSRDVNAFGYSPEQAIDNLATSHPNTEFRALLRGYLGSVSIGQSPSQYLQNKAETYLGRLEARYERFRENAGTAGEVVLIALMIVPITGLMYGASGASDMILVTTIPLIATGVFFMLDRVQVKGPPDNTKKKGPQVLSTAAGVAAAVVCPVILQVEPATAIFASVAAFAIPHGIIVRRRLRHQDKLLSDLAEFVRAVAEGMKTGLDVLSAIRHTDVDRFSVLNPSVKRIQHGLATGSTLDNYSFLLQEEGFYVKYAMFIMSCLAASGAASHAMLDRLGEYLGRIREQYARVKKSVTLYGFLVVASPLFMMFTIHATESISWPANSNTANEVGTGVPSSTLFALRLSFDSPTVQLMYLFTTVCAGIIGGKMSSQTVQDTLPLGVACLIAIASPAVFSMVWTPS